VVVRVVDRNTKDGKPEICTEYKLLSVAMSLCVIADVF
jgi:hypothetical protein